MSDPLPAAPESPPVRPAPDLEAELRRREAQLAHAQAIAHMGSWDWDIESNELTGSDEMYRIYGFEIGEELTTSRILSRIHPDDADALREAIDGAVVDGRDFDLEHRVVRPDGDVRLVHSRGRVVRNARGETVTIVGAGHDITERREAEERLRRREAELAEAQAVAHVGSFVWDMTTNELRGSDELFRIYGFEPMDVAPADLVLRRVHPEDMPLVQRTVEQALADGRDFEIEHRIQRSPDDLRWFRVSGRAVVSLDGSSVRVVGAGQDVTERVEAEALARRLAEESSARSVAEAGRRRAELVSNASRTLGTSFDYQTTLAQTAALFVPALADYCTIDLLSDGGQIERVGVSHTDPAKAALLRDAVRRSEKHGLRTVPHLARAIHEGLPTLLPSFSREQMLASAVDEEHRQMLLALDPHSLLCVPLRSGARVIGALVLYASTEGRNFDEDDLRMAEEVAGTAGLAVENARLYAQAQAATAARDQMLGVVAHDLRNPLNTMLMASELVEDLLPADSPSRQHVAIVRRAGDSMNRLIQDLLDVRRMETGKLTVEPQPTETTALIAETSALMRPLADRAGIAFDVRADDALPPVQADVARIQQVLSNLIGNALKFTPRGGRITLHAVRLEENVRFGVEDTGPGIPAEQLPAVFGQFWQAGRNDRRGLGLGLTIARGIIDAHQGTIWVESTVGVGTRFHFTLPIAAAAETV